VYEPDRAGGRFGPVVSKPDTEVDGGIEVAVPDSLLMPLIEAAADVLRALEAVDVPAQLRPLHGFDRRGLLAGPGPRQLRRALLTDASFREQVLEQFLARSEVEGMLAAWDAGNAAAGAADAAARGDLALYASTLWAARPDGSAFGLGVAVVLDGQARDRQRDELDGKSWDQERAALEEARRRAEVGRMEAEAATARVEHELQRERSARRTREDDAMAAAAVAQRQVDALQTELDQARAEAEEQQHRATRSAQRAHALEEDLRRARADARDLRAKAESLESHLGARDERALADAAAAARQLSFSLDALQRRIKEAPDASTRPEVLEVTREREPAPLKRAAPRLPPGVLADSAPGLEAMLATPDVVLVVDGYNIAHVAWGEATPGDQRERLGIAATALTRRRGCEIVLVFDGDGSGPRAPLRRGGVRVLFSDAGEEADDVVVREVEARSKRVPVVVASSDAWVREHATRQGAIVISAATLVRVMKPGS
jgi:predicted RNA-binding protein with PIN domain